MDNKTESSFKTKCCWWWRCERAQTWLRPLTSVVCHEMLFWCQSQLRWPLLPPHNTSSTPQPSVLLIHWASTCIPTIHFPWRLSFSLSLPLTLLLLFFLSLSLHPIERFRKERHTVRLQRSVKANTVSQHKEKSQMRRQNWLW